MVSPPNGICMSALAEPLCLQIRPAPWIVRELPPSLTAYHVTLCFHAGRYLPLSNVWSTVVYCGGEELGLLHIKQCFQNIRNVHSGANPLHSPSPKNKKPLTTAPLRFPKRGEACVNGFQELTATTTIALYHNLLECCQVLFKKDRK